MSDTNFKHLILCLSDGEFHSGESLGADLGVSRAAIWKRLKSLSERGVVVESVKGLGYRIPGGMSLLDAEQISRGMSEVAKPLLKQLHCFDSIHSTNDFLVKSVAASGEVCVAEQQRAGKGRRGRVWFSPFGKNVYLSVCWHFDGGVSSLDGLSLAVGVLLSEALIELGVQGLRLKWPNDLLVVDERGLFKLGGILIEVGGDLTGECKVVIGVGLNVALSDVLAEGDKTEIDQPWSDLKSAGYVGGRNTLICTLLSRLLPALSTYTADGFAHYRDRWESLNAYKGRRVCLNLSGREVYGQMVGVDVAGALILSSERGAEVFNGGEVSLSLLKKHRSGE